MLHVGQTIHLRRRASRILRLADELRVRSDPELLSCLANERRRMATGGSESAAKERCMAFVIEATDRVLGKRHYPVQVMAGLSLLGGGMVEMATGEGKTITALLPAMVRAFRGQGVHVVTANPYLAERDAELLRPVYEFAGLSVGCLRDDMDAEGKRIQYDCDITYGTGSNFGFDYLRDCIELGPDRAQVPPGTRSSKAVMQRGHYFALIDEADVILIDDSGTPLIIGAEQDIKEEHMTLLDWTAAATSQLQPGRHFGIDKRLKRAWLTPEGCQRLALIPKPAQLNGFGSEHLLDRTEKSIAASLLYARDRDYIVSEDEVQIVDPGTGRVLEGRKWQDGLHQAVEAKEGVPVTGDAAIAAQVTVQEYFRRYQHLSGMTGTAAQVAREVRRYYHMKVRPIPTNRPCARKDLGQRVFASLAAKHAAIRARVDNLVAAGRAVLIGVPSVEESAHLSTMLTEFGCECVLLNATQHEREAQIIAQAGRSGAVTIATNMAGRGTDILLTDECRSVGGLHVILAEVNVSRRFDRQLLGRAARQGDPGSFEFMVSLEDELMQKHASDLVASLSCRMPVSGSGELPSSWFHYFRRVQRQFERRDAAIRRDVWNRDLEQTRKRRRTGLDACLECID